MWIGCGFGRGPLGLSVSQYGAVAIGGFMAHLLAAQSTLFKTSESALAMMEAPIMGLHAFVVFGARKAPLARCPKKGARYCRPPLGTNWVAWLTFSQLQLCPWAACMSRTAFHPSVRRASCSISAASTRLCLPLLLYSSAVIGAAFWCTVRRYLPQACTCNIIAGSHLGAWAAPAKCSVISRW